MEQSISDDTMAGLSSLILTGETEDPEEMTEVTDATLDADSHDMFDSTLMGPQMTSTQNTTKPKDNTTQTDENTGPGQLKANLCMENCKFKDCKPKKIDKAGPVQCFMCQHWVHPPCVGERDDDIVNIWACPSCRKVPDKILNIMTTLNSLQQENKTLKETFIEKLTSIEQRLDHNHSKKGETKSNLAGKLTDALQAKTKEHVDAMTEITKLRSQISELNNKLNRQTWTEFGGNTASQNIVFGSSVIRDMTETHLQNTSIVCIPGGRIKDITEAVADKPDRTTYDQATLVVGGNDCDPRDPKKATTPSHIVSEYRTLVKLTKSRARTVNVSSVCPRMKSNSVKNRIDAVNAGLQVMCEEEGAVFTDNSPSFHLQDGTINDGYLLGDGIHLTNRATNKLAQNLKLKLKDGLENVCMKRQKQPMKTDKSTKDDYDNDQKMRTDIDTTHSFWSNARQKAYPQQQQQQRQQQHSQTHMKQNQRQSTDSTTTKDTARCYNCYEKNHTVKTCRHERPILCRECGSEGHKAKHHHSNSHSDY